MGKFAIRKTNTGIKFDLKASNGEVIATSEVYSSPVACKKGVASVQKNAPYCRCGKSDCRRLCCGKASEV